MCLWESDPAGFFLPKNCLKKHGGTADIIYSFCKMYALDKKVDQLLPLSAKNGLMNIVYDSGTFIRNQNIKGCDYD